ncbi:MAG: hypothetical protein ACFHVJ_02545 [Aestuariibacter sp.]
MVYDFNVLPFIFIRAVEAFFEFHFFECDVGIHDLAGFVVAFGITSCTKRPLRSALRILSSFLDNQLTTTVSRTAPFKTLRAMPGAPKKKPGDLPG